MRKEVGISLALSVAALTLGSQAAWATCKDISYSQLKSAAQAAVTAEKSGYGLPMWVTMVDETGKICHVVNSTDGKGHNSGALWLGSRNISAQKASTANAFSIDGYAISTANLYTPVNQGQSLFGLQASNPINGSLAYTGSPNQYGTKNDPLKNKRIGGVNVFGGGLAVYSGGNKKIGAIGVSGDTSCRDHAVAWLIRAALNGHPGGTGITTANYTADGTAVAINGTTGTSNAFNLKGDELILINDVTGASDAGEGWGGWKHPACPRTAAGSADGTAANGIIVVKNKAPD